LPYTEVRCFNWQTLLKTVPKYGAITPRWLVRLLDWKSLDAGTFRVNRVDEGKAVESTCGQVNESAYAPPETLDAMQSVNGIP
jgi:hypothetical protein